MIKATIAAIATAFPETKLTNEDLAALYPGFTAEKIESKTGIRNRRIAGQDECSSDLAVAAAENLFAKGVCDRSEIDFVLLCTQSPDYFLPTTACLVQDRLGLPTTTGALDFNLGCSGFVYGLGLAKGLVESGQAKNLLLITAETYSKFIHPGDKSVRTIFGDGASATLVRAVDCAEDSIGPFVYGTDGSGAQNLIVPTGGLRRARVDDAPSEVDASANERTVNDLYMNGPAIFEFTLRTVPASIDALLAKAGVAKEDIDLFVFHQANAFMLNHLRSRMGIPKEKFPITMAEIGNTVSSTIPAALEEAEKSGLLKPGSLVLLAGFGVGYSWSGALVRWTDNA